MEKEIKDTIRKLVEESMSEETVRKETQEHIDTVGRNIDKFIEELKIRKDMHDRSKLEAPEFETFVEFTPKLKHSTYGSDEYNQFLKDMKPALDHHYSNNSHHPEYHDNGINGMTLVDLFEMLADWHAATQRHADGDIMRSIELNKDRFEISDQLCDILRNTAELLSTKPDTD